MIALASTLCWAALAALFVARLDRWAHRWLDLHDPAKREQANQLPPIPDDLTAFAMGETETWAQDSVLSGIRERWEKFKNWNQVRASLGLGVKDGEG